jgi:hypothetical protein
MPRQVEVEVKFTPPVRVPWIFRKVLNGVPLGVFACPDGNFLPSAALKGQRSKVKGQRAKVRAKV